MLSKGVSVLEYDQVVVTPAPLTAGSLFIQSAVDRALHVQPCAN